MTESLWGQYQRAVSRWTEDQSEANRLALVAAYGGWVRSFCPSYVDEPEQAASIRTKSHEVLVCAPLGGDVLHILGQWWRLPDGTRNAEQFGIR